MKIKTIHDLIYYVMQEICYDREYLYMKFVDTFSKIVNDIFHKGHILMEKAYQIDGLKSQKTALIEWRLSQKPNFYTYNEVQFVIRVTGEEVIRMRFELSMGEAIRIDT